MGGDQSLTCGVHIFDDPKSGAPYVVALPDVKNALHRAGGALRQHGDDELEDSIKVKIPDDPDEVNSLGLPPALVVAAPLLSVEFQHRSQTGGVKRSRAADFLWGAQAPVSMIQF